MTAEVIRYSPETAHPFEEAKMPEVKLGRETGHSRAWLVSGPASDILPDRYRTVAGGARAAAAELSRITVW